MKKIINSSEDKTVILGLFCILLILFLLLQIINQRKDITHLQYREKYLDSCAQSNFERLIDCDRVENTMEIFEKRHPEMSVELDSLFILSE